MNPEKKDMEDGYLDQGDRGANGRPNMVVNAIVVKRLSKGIEGGGLFDILLGHIRVMAAITRLDQERFCIRLRARKRRDLKAWIMLL